MMYYRKGTYKQTLKNWNVLKYWLEKERIVLIHIHEYEQLIEVRDLMNDKHIMLAYTVDKEGVIKTEVDEYITPENYARDCIEPENKYVEAFNEIDRLLENSHLHLMGTLEQKHYDVIKELVEKEKPMGITSVDGVNKCGRCGSVIMDESRNFMLERCGQKDCGQVADYWIVNGENISQVGWR